MAASILEPYYRINQATGIHLNIDKDDVLRFDVCEVSVSGNQLSLTRKLTAIEGVESVLEFLPEGCNFALNITGRGVLEKQIARVGAISQQNFGSVLPADNFTDFYVQNFASGDISFISVIRKAEADKWFGLLTQKGARLLSLSLGPFAIDAITPQLNVYEGDIRFDGHHISRNEQMEWTGYQQQEKAQALFPLKIGPEVISEKLLLAYAAAFQLVMARRIQGIRAQVPVLEHHLRDTIAAIIFKTQALLLLLSFFVLLLFNFVTLSKLDSANQGLSAKVSKSSQNATALASVVELQENKQALLKELGWNGGPDKSQQIDQLATLLPADVTLNSLTVNPVNLAKENLEKTVRFTDGCIRVTGIAERIVSVNEWLARIRTLKWVKRVSLESYIFNPEFNTGQFTITISY